MVGPPIGWIGSFEDERARGSNVGTPGDVDARLIIRLPFRTTQLARAGFVATSCGVGHQYRRIRAVCCSFERVRDMVTMPLEMIDRRGAVAAGPAARTARLARSFALLESWRRALVATLAGAAVALAHAPFDLVPVLFVAFPILVLLLDGVVPREGSILSRVVPVFGVGWCFGFGMYWGGLWWLGNALVVSGAAPGALALLAPIPLAAFLALFPAFATVVARQLWTDGVGRVLVLGAAWGIAEWLRSFVLTGLPWNAIGYAAMPTPVAMQSIAAVGMDGLNVLVVWAAAAPALLVDRRTRLWGVLLPLLLIVGHIGFGTARLALAEVEGSGTTVRVVQPAVPQDEKWDAAAQLEIFESLVELSVTPAEGLRGAPADLVVWPETAVPFVLNRTPEALAVLGDALEAGQSLLAGGVRIEGIDSERLLFNSLYVVGSEGQIVASRDKVHLVPFGEYLPFPDLLERIGLSRIVEAQDDFTAGPRRMTLPLAAGPVLLPLICYEAIFPTALRASGPAPTAIVNITNDGWFGPTPGPHQHMRQSRVRAVESGLPMIRAANDGISAVVDPYGRVLAGLGHGARGAFEAELPQPIAAPFPVARSLPTLWLLSVVAFAMVVVDGVRERRRRAKGIA